MKESWGLWILGKEFILVIQAGRIFVDVMAALGALILRGSWVVIRVPLRVPLKGSIGIL